MTKWIDEGSPVDIIYLDFQKAFDKLPHQRLLLTLKAHGIGDGIIDWIEQWLIDSFVTPPQVLLFGPLLFLIYINDLDDNITSNLLIFDIYTKVFRKINADGDKHL